MFYLSCTPVFSTMPETQQALQRMTQGSTELLSSCRCVPFTQPPRATATLELALGKLWVWNHR